MTKAGEKDKRHNFVEIIYYENLKDILGMEEVQTAQICIVLTVSGRSNDSQCLRCVTI